MTTHAKKKGTGSISRDTVQAIREYHALCRHMSPRAIADYCFHSNTTKCKALMLLFCIYFALYFCLTLCMCSKKSHSDTSHTYTSICTLYPYARSNYANTSFTYTVACIMYVVTSIIRTYMLVYNIRIYMYYALQAIIIYAPTCIIYLHLHIICYYIYYLYICAYYSCIYDFTYIYYICCYFAVSMLRLKLYILFTHTHEKS